MFHLFNCLIFRSGVPSLTGTATLIVTLTDVNDNFPVFAENYRPVIYENEPPGQFVVRKLTSAIFMFEML